MIFLIFVLAFMLVGLYLAIKGQSDFQDMIGAVCIFLSFIIMVAWISVYVDNWNNQRKVEAFTQSGVYLSFVKIATSESSTINLNPIGNNLLQLYKDINEYNKFIVDCNASNNNFWFDWNYPDWEAPELITIP